MKNRSLESVLRLCNREPKQSVLFTKQISVFFNENTTLKYKGIFFSKRFVKAANFILKNDKNNFSEEEIEKLYAFHKETVQLIETNGFSEFWKKIMLAHSYGRKAEYTYIRAKYEQDLHKQISWLQEGCYDMLKATEIYLHLDTLRETDYRTFSIGSAKGGYAAEKIITLLKKQAMTSTTQQNENLREQNLWKYFSARFFKQAGIAQSQLNTKKANLFFEKSSNLFEELSQSNLEFETATADAQLQNRIKYLSELYAVEELYIDQLVEQEDEQFIYVLDSQGKHVTELYRLTLDPSYFLNYITFIEKLIDSTQSLDKSISFNLFKKIALFSNISYDRIQKSDRKNSQTICTILETGFEAAQQQIMMTELCIDLFPEEYKPLLHVNAGELAAKRYHLDETEQSWFKKSYQQKHAAARLFEMDAPQKAFNLYFNLAKETYYLYKGNRSKWKKETEQSAKKALQIINSCEIDYSHDDERTLLKIKGYAAQKNFKGSKRLGKHKKTKFIKH
jgi:hypothetical protein